MKVLVIEGDILYGRKIKQWLEINQYKVTLTDDSSIAMKLAFTNQYDSLILSTLIPKSDQKNFIHSIRDKGLKTPIIVVTNKSEVSERIRYLDTGADDYLDKSMSSEEFLSRFMAVMRRANHRYTNQYTIGGIHYDASLCQIGSSVELVSLKPKESQLLECLIINQNLALSKHQLVGYVWGNTRDFNFNLVEVYISQLRKKLNHLDAKVSIQTIRNQGYVLKTMNRIENALCFMACFAIGLLITIPLMLVWLNVIKFLWIELFSK